MLGLLYHLDDAGAVALMRLAKAAMKPEGALITLDGCYRPGQSALVKYLLDHDRGEYVREADSYVRLAEQIFGKVNPQVREDLFFIPYTCVVMCCKSGGEERGEVNG